MFERRLFPEALAMGMPSEEFWHGKPSRLLGYVEAYKIRLGREEEIKANLIDYQSWLTGLYVHNALGVVLGNAFSKGKKAKYVAEPISFTQRKQHSVGVKEAEEKALQQQYLAFKQFTDAVNGGQRKR